MKKFFLIIAMTLFTYSSIVFSSPIHSLVYKGDIVENDNQFPFVVGIYKKETNNPNEELKTTCTGSVINKMWVLTAAHCVMEIYDEDRDVKNLNISIGTGHLAKYAKSAIEVIPVEKIFVWNTKEFSDDHDIALLKLAKPTAVTPVKLPEMPDDGGEIKKGFREAISVGYGWVDIDLTDDEHPKIIFDDKLHYGRQVIQTDEKVEELITNYLKRHPWGPHMEAPVYNPLVMIGVIPLTGQHNTPGDSGGPLLIAADNNPQSMTIIGVTSWATPLTKETFKSGEWLNEQPEVYMNLLYSGNLAYIKNTIKNNP